MHIDMDKLDQLGFLHTEDRKQLMGVVKIFDKAVDGKDFQLSVVVEHRPVKHARIRVWDDRYLIGQLDVDESGKTTWHSRKLETNDNAPGWAK